MTKKLACPVLFVLVLYFVLTIGRYLRTYWIHTARSFGVQYVCTNYYIPHNTYIQGRYY